jgi:hypothetical protein
MDACTFQRTGRFSLRVQCAACRHRHEFKVDSGRLVPLRPVQSGNTTSEFEAARNPNCSR